MLTIVKDDVISLLKKYIDVFSVLHVDEENHLTVREKEYLVINILLNANGIDLSSRKASKILEDKFGFKNRGVSIYRSKLKDKGWMIQTSTGIEIVKAFDFSKAKLPTELTFNFKVKLKPKEVKEVKEVKEKNEEQVG